jgi:hypothetical protein
MGNFLSAGDFRATFVWFAPLSDLDLPATHKANDDRGVDFQIPASTGQ